MPTLPWNPCPRSRGIRIPRLTTVLLIAIQTSGESNLLNHGAAASFRIQRAKTTFVEQ
jgi:hypothetical protein